MVRVGIDLRKRDFVWIGLIVVLLGVGFVVAYGGNQPSVMGHSSGEVMVNVGGVDKPLQAAIDAGDFAGMSYVYSCRNSNDVANAPICPASVTIGTQGPCGAGFIATKYLGEWGGCGQSNYEWYIPPTTTGWSCLGGWYGGPQGKAWLCSQ